ncbi:hypothetical protein VTG60DRAFT_6183 [Thermothelomyces hinnuleus]
MSLSRLLFIKVPRAFFGKDDAVHGTDDELALRALWDRHRPRSKAAAAARRPQLILVTGSAAAAAAAAADL